MRLFLFFLLHLSLAGGLLAEEKTDWDYPLGPIGGRCYLQLGENSVRVSEVTPGEAGAIAGLQMNDYIIGAFGTPFDKAVDDTWNFYTGPLKGLGEAIEKAERGDGILQLMVLRSEVGTLTLPIQLEANGGLGPVFPLGSDAFAEAYEAACLSIHEGIINETWRGNSGASYPRRWAGLALLSHPDWNSTTGDRPYRLSIDLIRDTCLSSLANAQYAPVEQTLLDRITANPNFVNQFAGHENWALNTSLMFLAEYLQKTKDSQYYDEFQTAAEKIANRIQWWAQTESGLRHPPAGGAHAGVHSDYNGSGFNICVTHSYSALAMAKQVTDTERNPVLDLSVRARDGRHYGYAEGETKPDLALPALPDGWDPAIDPSITEKMDWQWQQLKESMHPEYGAIHYWHGLTTPTFARDGFARNGGAIFGYFTSLGDQTIPESERPFVERMIDYNCRFQREHQNAHTHTLTAVTFNHLSMTYWTPQQRRHLLDNWKFYWNLARQPNGPPEYFTTLFEHDGDSFYLLGEIFTAIPYGVASGGLSLIPGWDTEELTIDFHQVPHQWDVPEYRTLTTDTGTLDINLDLTNGLGTEISPDSVTWTALSANATHFLASNPSSLTTT